MCTVRETCCLSSITDLGHLKAYSGMVHGDRKGNKQGGRPSLLARHRLGLCALLLSLVLHVRFAGQLIAQDMRLHFFLATPIRFLVVSPDGRARVRAVPQRYQTSPLCCRSLSRASSVLRWIAPSQESTSSDTFQELMSHFP